MEKFLSLPLTEVIRSLLKLCRQLTGPDRDDVRRLASQTLQTALVNHQEGVRRKQNRETLHRKKPKMGLRSLSPIMGTLLLNTLNHLLELEEEKTARGLLGDQMILPPRIRRNRYTVSLVGESIRNTLAGVVGTAMTQYDYSQREARAMFEVVIQDRSSVKQDNKFYEKRTEIKGTVKDRFAPTNWFQISEKEIQTVVLSESEAEEKYAILELCARFLGAPVFSAPFNPNQPFPALASNAHNFDEENKLEHLRIGAFINPISFNNLVESLEYTIMKKKAKGPVLNAVVVSGNGNSDNQWLLSEDSEADIEADINAIVNDYVDSAQFRRLLKHPKLEVVVDGTAISAPFAATTGRRFQLPGPAKFVQVFATQNGRRHIVSSLSLRQTEISGGKTWHSELELEGKQVVKLSVEPVMDGSGRLASSSLLVGFQPKLIFVDMITAPFQESWSRGRAVWPAWMTKPVFAAIVAVLALAPFSTIDIFSLLAFFILMLSVTAWVFVAGKINPAWRLVRPHLIALNGFVSIVLVVMLFLGILPHGRVPTPAIGAIPIASLTGTVSSAALVTPGAPFAAKVITLGPDGPTSRIWSVSGSYDPGSQLNLSIPNGDYDPTQQYLLVLPNRTSDFWPSRLQYAGTDAAFLSGEEFNIEPGSLSSAWLQSVYSELMREDPRSGGPNYAGAAMAKKNVPPTDRAHVARQTVEGSIPLRDVFRVEVLADTNEIIPLIGHDDVIATELATKPVGEPPPTSGTPGVPGNPAVADVGKQPSGDDQRGAAEAKKAADSVANPTAAPVRNAPAWVVFDSPTELGSLNKGDVVNANFKSMLSKTDPQGGLLECTATGVVQDKRTSGDDVEVRVGLKLTGVHNGKPVNGRLDLLLTDDASDKENSHHGFLAAPRNKVAEVARIEPRVRKP